MITRRVLSTSPLLAGLTLAGPVMSQTREQGGETPRILRLLSIDGGGIRGIAAARILARLDEEFVRHNGRRLVDCFDIFAGTSTGSIIAAGLAASKDRSLPWWQPAQIEKIYRDRGIQIFGPRPSGGLFDRSRQRWDSRGLSIALSEVFQDLRLEELPGNLIVPFYNMRGGSEGTSVVALGGPIAGMTTTRALQVRRVVQASSSAPTYFNPTEMDGGALGVDGGVFANNPALVAWVQAQQLFPETKCLVVSVGCGTKSANYPVNGTWGPLEWFDPTKGVPLIDVLMRGQGDLVDNQMAILLNRDKNYFRFQFSLDGTRYGALDDASAANLDDMVARAESMMAAPRSKKAVRALLSALDQSFAAQSRTPVAPA